MLKVKLSKGNSKMGRVMSVSLPPVKSCGAALPCFKNCYARKIGRIRPVVDRAWESNWRLAMTDRNSYFEQIRAALEKEFTPLFRWHVAGDIPDFAYLYNMFLTAELFPDTKFLAFTKKYDLIRLHVKHPAPTWLPRSNLSIILSMWPGLDVPPAVFKRFPKAWMRDKKDPDKRIPENAVTCDGGCEKCGLCWGMGPRDNIVFDKH